MATCGSVVNRKGVTILLVVVSVLLVVNLYRMDKLSAVFRENFTSPPKKEKVERIQEKVVRIKQTAGPPRSHVEMVQASQELHRMLIQEGAERKCRDLKFIKNKHEGAWRYCADDIFKFQKPCLVYSFGIDYDFTFDDALGKLGCDVHAFDPSMNTSTHRRNENVMFYQTGLSGADSDSFSPNLDNYVKKATTWKVRTLKSLMAELGHSDRIIDLLKIDIEVTEWAVIREALNSGVLSHVKQLIMEWHIFPKIPAREEFFDLITTIQDLRVAGFESYDKNPHTPNTIWAKFNLQCDVGYVNTNFEKTSKAL